MAKKIKRGDENFDKLLCEMRERFHGMGGDEESESHINCNKQDLKDGYVWFWSNNKDVAKLITRSSKFILEVQDFEDAVQFKVSKEGFRSVPHAFKVGK